MKTLWELKRGESALIKGFDETLQTVHKHRLHDLGFEMGQSITCLMTPPFGAPRVFQIADSVFSLAKEIAQQVSVCRGKL
jgi:ferrous iron transport protein A